MSRPVLKECFEVPIYDSKVWLIVTDSITRERKKWEHEFGPWNETSEYNGLCSYNGRRVGIFIDREHTDEIGLIAHEVFHATHRILGMGWRPILSQQPRTFRLHERIPDAIDRSKTGEDSEAKTVGLTLASSQVFEQHDVVGSTRLAILWPVL